MNRVLRLLPLILVPVSAQAESIPLDQRPAEASDWGYRPAEGGVSAVNPPSFCWRPQEGIASWEVRCLAAEGTESASYSQSGIVWNVHCPNKLFPPGEYRWQYRGVDSEGRRTEWSQTRSFQVPAGAREMPMPAREELLARIPAAHPRLFVRPEQLPQLRQLARGSLKQQYDALVAESEKLLKNPPPTEEPPKYGDIERKSEPWREIWWGNRVYTIRALDGAATLAFTRLLGGREEFGQAARRILLECAKWDPKGATGYRYNDEAGMPYAYYFSRTYSFVYDLLSEEERRTCRQVMKIRGDEMYAHLCPRHLWNPYSSHSNRAWHFLGEVGIAFLGEVEGADDWVWFAMNVFYNAYPVWSDADGGWHEGSAYWDSYLNRFTWWADVMRAAMGIDAYDKPFFSQIGYYPMYLMPPGKSDGGLGDLADRRTAESNGPLMAVLASQAGNPYWQWYVEQVGGRREPSGYIGFVRGAQPPVKAKPPADLPSSRCFWGTGQAYLNSNLLSARQGAQVVFKSSPFGTQSHGYEANNSFLLSAYGERLLINTGVRDIYGSDHHQRWMWSTRSVNNITVDGQGQTPHSAAAQGRIVDFQTSGLLDGVVGEAGATYVGKKTEKNPDGRLLDRFTRSIVFVKPSLVVVYDRLEARQEGTFEYWLHAVNEIAVESGQTLRVDSGGAACRIEILRPQGLTFSQTNQYDPNPRERVKLRQWHLTAKTGQKARKLEFVTLLWPHRKGEAAGQARLETVDGGYLLTGRLAGGEVAMLLPADDSVEIKGGGLSAKGNLAVRFSPQDEAGETMRLKQ